MRFRLIHESASQKDYNTLVRQLTNKLIEKSKDLEYQQRIADTHGGASPRNAKIRITVGESKFEILMNPYGSIVSVKRDGIDVSEIISDARNDYEGLSGLLISSAYDSTSIDHEDKVVNGVFCNIGQYGSLIDVTTSLKNAKKQAVWSGRNFNKYDRRDGKGGWLPPANVPEDLDKRYWLYFVEGDYAHSTLRIIPADEVGELDTYVRKCVDSYVKDAQQGLISRFQDPLYVKNFIWRIIDTQTLSKVSEDRKQIDKHNVKQLG